MPHRSTSSESKQNQDRQPRRAERSTNAQRGTMTHRDPATVQTFFDQFAKAITSGDTKAAAELWEAPAFVIDDRATVAVGSLDDVERFFAGAKDQYNAQGITTTVAEIIDLDWISDNLVVARVRWPYLDDLGKERGAESSSYTLKRNSDGDLKLRVVLMRGVEDTAKHRKN